jgi:hypothetical protein
MDGGLLTLDNIVEGRRYTFHLSNGQDITGIYRGIFDPGNPAHEIPRYLDRLGIAIIVYNEALGNERIIYLIEISYITQPRAGGRRRSIRRRHRRSRRSRKTPRF